MYKKYIVTIKYKSGLFWNGKIEEIHFHTRSIALGTGGIDLFNNGSSIPFFPGKEEDVESITIKLN
jgi:hypothetical protein